MLTKGTHSSLPYLYANEDPCNLDVNVHLVLMMNLIEVYAWLQCQTCSIIHNEVFVLLLSICSKNRSTN